MFVTQNKENSSIFELYAGEQREVPDALFWYEDGIAHVELNKDVDFTSTVKTVLMKVYKTKIDDIDVTLSESLFKEEKDKYNKQVELEKLKEEERQRILKEQEELRLLEEEERKAQSQVMYEKLELQRQEVERQKKMDEERIANEVHKDDIQKIKNDMNELQNVLLQKLEEVKKESTKVVEVQVPVKYTPEEEQEPFWVLVNEEYELQDNYKLTFKLTNVDQKFMLVTFGQKIKLFFRLVGLIFKFIKNM